MAENSAQEKTQEATPKRRTDARRRGEVARSRELNTNIMLLSGCVGLLVMLGWHGSDGLDQFAALFVIDRAALFSERDWFNGAWQALLETWWYWLPYWLLGFAAAFAGPLLMGGWTFSREALQPKFKRIDPLAGLKRIFGAQALVEMFKSFGKFILIAGIAVAVFYHHRWQLLSLGQLPELQAIFQGMTFMVLVLFLLSVGLILITLIDVPWQIFSHNKRMRMTLQEIRDERKQTDGAPEIRTRVRAMQREVSQRRMLGDVRSADVVITNPEHYSVALRYQQDAAAVPVVVAKGTDFMALRIREIASAHSVSIVPAPPLARALYHSTECQQTIPVDLYLAVAQVLAYVFRLNEAMTADHRTWAKAAAALPRDLPVPSHYRKIDSAAAAAVVTQADRVAASDRYS